MGKSRYFYLHRKNVNPDIKSVTTFSTYVNYKKAIFVLNYRHNQFKCLYLRFFATSGARFAGTPNVLTLTSIFLTTITDSPRLA